MTVITQAQSQVVRVTILSYKLFVFKKLKTFSAKLGVELPRLKSDPDSPPFLPLDISSKLSSSPSNPLFFHCKNKNVNDNSTPQFINKVCTMYSLHSIEIF